MIHTAPFVDAALASLQRQDDYGLASLLELVNAEADPDLAITGPLYFSDGTKEILNTPFIEVAAPTWRLSELDLHQLSMRFEVTLAVRAMLDDARAERLYARLQMLGAAVLDCLCQPAAVGPASILSIDGEYPINPQDPESTGPRFEGYALLVVTLEAVDQRSVLPGG